MACRLDQHHNARDACLAMRRMIVCVAKHALRKYVRTGDPTGPRWTHIRSTPAHSRIDGGARRAGRAARQRSASSAWPGTPEAPAASVFPFRLLCWRRWSRHFPQRVLAPGSAARALKPTWHRRSLEARLAGRVPVALPILHPQVWLCVQERTAVGAPVSSIRRHGRHGLLLPLRHAALL